MATVLIVDDDAKLLKMLQRTLVYEGFHVLSATNGNEALAEVQAHRPDVVILDWHPHERAEVLADTTDEVERLIRLVNQLLVLARADAGQTLRREPLPIQPLLEDVCRQAKLLSSRTIFLPDLPVDATVLGDRDALKQVLLILVDNALVHTSPAITVELTAARVDGQVAVSVHDTGPGIAAEALPHIFERFYRGQVSRSGTSTGLGLAIAKELVEAQGGTIAVESEEGQGTTFVVTLPQTA